MRQILGVYSAPSPHWVGDGFPVRTMLSHHDQGAHVSPFIMLDYAGPAKFAPTTARRGVGAHPHKGFETVTIVYSGEVEHRDSTGAGGVIGPGDVQWMTAASGIVHEEYHSPAFAAKGGDFEMVQLWVNLPAKDKAAKPGYQTLLDAQIPTVELANGAGKLRVIAGSFARRERSGADVHADQHLGCAPRRRQVRDARCARRPHGFDRRAVGRRRGQRQGNRAGGADWCCSIARAAASRIEANGDAKLLVLTGEPINEPVVAHGPFVMNTVGEIKQAMLDFQNGKFGAMRDAPVP